jgi:DNA-binding MarR family transcriptional regulator
VRLARPRLHRPALANIGAPAIDPAAYATLGWIGDSAGCRLTELAALLGVDISTTSRQVSSLELAGLVERRADPDDQRVKLLELSGTGATLLERARAAREEGVAALLDGWSKDDVAELARLLERLATGLAEPFEADAPAPGLEATR